MRTCRHAATALIAKTTCHLKKNERGLFQRLPNARLLRVVEEVVYGRMLDALDGRQTLCCVSHGSDGHGWLARAQVAEEFANNVLLLPLSTTTA